MTGTTLHTYNYIPRGVLERLATPLAVRAPMLAALRELSRRSMTRHRRGHWVYRYLAISRVQAPDQVSKLGEFTGGHG
jgi:hypothetical protein